MAAHHLEDLLEQDPDITTSLQALSLIETAPLHRPDILHTLIPTIEHQLPTPSRLKLLERFALSCADLGSWDEYDSTITKLRNIIGGEDVKGLVRVVGIGLESHGDYEGAMEVYGGGVEKGSVEGVWRGNETVRVCWRRSIGVMKSKRMWVEAMAMCAYYLSVFAGDVECWIEFGCLCLMRGKVEKGLFCAVECLGLLGDGRGLVWVADCYYTVGGVEGLRKARAFYAESLRREEKGNLRALYGVWLCAMGIKRILEKEKGNKGVDVEKNKKLLIWVKDGLEATYRKSPHKSIVLTMLNGGIV